ncbi:MAG: hypothetical protein ACXW34_09015 [Nitrospira sp.]
MSDQNSEAVIIRLKLSDDNCGEWSEREATYAVEDRLSEVLKQSDIGELDGHEFGGGFATLFLYGPSARPIAEAILPTVQATTPRPGSLFTKRFGPPGSREETIALPHAAH